LATRSGSWVLNRVWEYGDPTDVVLLNRFAFGLRSYTPQRIQNSLIERKLNKRFDHERFGLKPAHRFLEAHITINDELPNRIACGTVIVKPNVQKIGENEVVSEWGNKQQTYYNHQERTKPIFMILL
jgi:dimethylaniline monooxygenase (N-oxide forming)